MPQYPIEQQLNPDTAPDILAALAWFTEQTGGDTLEPTVDTQALLLQVEYDPEPSTWLLDEALDRGVQACTALRQLDELTQMVGPHEAIDASAQVHASIVRRVAAWATTFGLEGEHAAEIFDVAAQLDARATETPVSLAASQGEWASMQPMPAERAAKRIDRTTTCVQQLEALRASGNLPPFLSARTLYNLLTGSLEVGKLDNPGRRLLDRILAKTGGQRTGRGFVAFSGVDTITAASTSSAGSPRNSEKDSADAAHILNVIDTYTRFAVGELGGADPEAQTYKLAEIMRELELVNSERIRQMLGDNLHNHKIGFVDRLALVVKKALDSRMDKPVIKYNDLRELVADAVERVKDLGEQTLTADARSVPQWPTHELAPAAGSIALALNGNGLFLEPVY